MRDAMGPEVLFWIWVLTWMAKRGAEDLVHAVKGTPNPRYELKKQRAAAAGKPVKGQPRYGTREWVADLYSDALAAHTEKRRAAAKAKGLPVDDMVDVVREPRRRNAERQAEHGEPEWLTPGPNDDALLYEGQALCPRCKTGQLAELSNGDRECVVCGPPRVRHETPEPPVPPRPAPVPEPDNRPDATIYQFPNPKHVEKEITVSNEVTGLATAIAYARDVAKAHESFTTSGAEGYVGALEQGGNGGEVIASAREAMEASAIATEKWAAHKAVLEKQLNVREAYQGNPDAGDKTFVVNE